MTDKRHTILEVIGFFEDAVDAALAEQRRPKGGMSVTFFGDFAGVPVSGLVRLKWWARRMREALEVRP